LQLTQYDERGWRATFHATGMEHSTITSTTASAFEPPPWLAVQEAAREARSEESTLMARPRPERSPTLSWSVLVAVIAAGCAVSPDIVLRNQRGQEVICERVTGIYGLRTHTLLTVQRQCVEDYQRQGYERVPSTGEDKR